MYQLDELPPKVKQGHEAVKVAQALVELGIEKLDELISVARNAIKKRAETESVECASFWQEKIAYYHEAEKHLLFIQEELRWGYADSFVWLCHLLPFEKSSENNPQVLAAQAMACGQGSKGLLPYFDTYLTPRMGPFVN